MSDFDINTGQDEDTFEISDLDPQNDGANTTFSLVLLRFVRKIPLFTSTQARSTTLALLACALMLLFLVQPGLPNVQRRISRTSELASSSTVGAQSIFVVIDAPSAHTVNWIRSSYGKVVVIQASDGTVGWHYCKVRHKSTPPTNAHPLVVVCI